MTKYFTIMDNNGNFIGLVARTREEVAETNNYGDVLFWHETVHEEVYDGISWLDV